MAALSVADRPRQALLVFADIVDSSKFSAVLDYDVYARRVLGFQEIFLSLAQRYFPQPPDKTRGYTQVDARGDEGIIFVLGNPQEESANEKPEAFELLVRAIEFLAHLKGQLKFASAEAECESGAPLQIGIGAGVHYGRVAFATDIVEGHSEIRRLEGFAINFAKRVESCSREGKHSRIVLSRPAFKLLEGGPIVFSRFFVPMKGIEEKSEVFEVRAGLFSGLRIDPTDGKDEQLTSKIGELARKPGEIDEPWVKSLVLSVLDKQLADSRLESLRNEYRDLQSRVAWYSAIEDDPVLLLFRAKDLTQKREHSQKIRYLDRIIREHPDFIPARKMMIEACWSTGRQKSMRSELSLARDLAKELLGRFPIFLNLRERARYRSIVNKINRMVKGRKASRLQ